MRGDWLWTIFIIVWAINGLIDVIDFSFQAGDKNQVTIEKAKKEKPEESTSDMPKASW